MIAMPANSVLFEDVCRTLERVHKKKVKRERQKLLTDFIYEIKSKIRDTEGEKNTTLYPVMRLLVPKLERERPAYNIKERKLGELLVKILPLPKESQEAKNLLRDRSAHTSYDRDFGHEVYIIAKNKFHDKTGNLTVKDINDILDKIATAEVGNKGPALDEAFSCARRNLNAEQLKWFIRIILKDLKLGMSDKSILACFHPDAPEHHSNCNNIAQVCEDLDDSNNRPLSLGVKIFCPVSPMLSEQLNVTEVSFLPPDKTFQVEQKFDGERFQIHMNSEGEFAYFSRRGHPFVRTYGKNYDEGVLTPYFKGCFREDVRNFIMDGEMMLWHKEDQYFGCKALPCDVKEITDKSPYRACFCAYDLLYYNDRSLVGAAEKGGLPLKKRLEILDGMFTDVMGVIQHSKRKIIQKRTDILDELNAAMSNEEEGLVVKDVDSYYMAGERYAGWYKLKSEYTDGATPELDLAVIGVDVSASKRQVRVKSFYVACLDKTGTEWRWLCVGHVASGLKYDVRARIVTILKEHWNRTTEVHPPNNLVFNKAKPDYWILPEHSIVLEIRATELVKSSSYGTPYTMRFPRIVSLRDDKPICDTMTQEEFLRPTINKGEVVKLATKRINEDQLVNSEVKVSRKRVTKTVQVAEPFRIDSGVDVVATSNILAGRKICILSGDDDCPRSELIKIVAMHGGKTVMQPGADTWCCVVGARGVLAAPHADVVSAAWLRALSAPPPPAHPAPAPPPPAHPPPVQLVHTTRRTRLELAAQYDAVGDSYTEPIDQQFLKLCFAKIDRDEPDIYLTTPEMLELDKEIFGDTNPYSFLRSCFIHLVNCKSINETLSKMFAANLCEVNTYNLTHIIVGKQIAGEQISSLRELNKHALVVSEDWLEGCLAQKKLISESTYLL